MDFMRKSRTTGKHFAQLIEIVHYKGKTKDDSRNLSPNLQKMWEQHPSHTDTPPRAPGRAYDFRFGNRQKKAGLNSKS